ncbi:cytochrome P450 [Mycobacterium sp. 48b]|uniref:cytochrome P450 n=1 Tax=Mycobacterium sp. 48b TaxID=3400426 RepID=UPI003AB10313
MTAYLEDVRLHDPALFREGSPNELIKYLRENDPVHWTEETDGPGYWAVTRYDDIKQIELDSETYSNEPVVTISDLNTKGSDENHKMLIYSDAPWHTEHRKKIAPELSLSRVRKGREGMDSLVNLIVDMVIEKGEADLVTDLSGKMASYAIADLMGLDREHSLSMFRAAEILNQNIDTNSGIGLEATMTLVQHAAEAYNERQENPRNDTLTRLTKGEIQGRPADELQFNLDFMLFIAAGSDTSRNVLSTGMLTLLQHPEAWNMLRDNPERMPKAIEEMLRYNPPIMVMRRTTTRDTELRGRKIKQGQKVVIYYAGANRDPAVFEDPDKFDITRKVNPHMSFGAGRHHCLGAHLARLELTSMFDTMLRRMPDMELAGPVVWPEPGDVPMVTGPEHMPIRFTPGEREVTGDVESVFA